MGRAALARQSVQAGLLDLNGSGHGVGPVVHAREGRDAMNADVGRAESGPQGIFAPHNPTEPRSGLCPACVVAGKPTRDGLEQAVVIVAGQTLTGAETLDLADATPEELAYHLGAVKRSLRSLLQLLAPVPGGEDR
ncbi:hypothetical protein [Streptomyces sp. MK37H]|uniref:hypothetical protein n=1 Tax=Streptomyces sp. MK37H TaxID=2699117 RepID=UPI001B38A2E8|nr:hypothetical protein [Streptomyces sp. MK37H]MBP8532212.1 hypothetical protein [Streptomyces sp. MK37H]